MICFNALHGPFGEDGKIQNIKKIESNLLILDINLLKYVLIRLLQKKYYLKMVY